MAQQFTQGNIDFTGNSLDMAVSGEGFFTLSDNGTTVYSRAGNFSTDASGYVVNPSGQRLQVFAPNDDGTTFNTGKLSDLQLATGDAPPKVSTKVQASVTLPRQRHRADQHPVQRRRPDHLQPDHLADGVRLARRGAHPVAVLQQDRQPQRMDRADPDRRGQRRRRADADLRFQRCAGPARPTASSPCPPTPRPAAPARWREPGPEQVGAVRAEVRRVGAERDGYGTGSLSGISVSSEGVVQASYSNGVTKAIGQVALSSFASPRGLQQKGDNAFAETFASGQAVRGAAGTSDFGLVQGGAGGLNVDQTAELVNMISAQRNFQANAQMIQTQDQITQTIINLR